MKKIITTTIMVLVAAPVFAATDYNSSRSNKNSNGVAVDVTASTSVNTNANILGDGVDIRINKNAEAQTEQQQAQADAFMKIDDIKGESQDRALIKFDGVDGEAQAEAFIKIDDIKGESQDKASSGSKKGYDYYKAQSDNASAASGINWTIVADEDTDLSTQNSVAIQSTQKKKLFGLFSVEMKVRAQMDANGQVSDIRKPWYAMFAW